MRSNQRWKLAGLLLLDLVWIGFSLSRSMKPAAVSSSESGWVLNLVRAVFPFATMHLVRKAAHFIEYFVLGILHDAVWRTACKSNLLVPILAGLFVAAADELLQRSIPGRSGQLSDVVLDFCGVLAACLLMRLLRILRAKTKKTQ